MAIPIIARGVTYVSELVQRMPTFKKDIKVFDGQDVHVIGKEYKEAAGESFTKG
jgi:hypothetical protein